jgi:hypothetical protein
MGSNDLKPMGLQPFTHPADCSFVFEDSPPLTPRSDQSISILLGMQLPLLTPVKTGCGNRETEATTFLSPTSVLEGGVFSPDSVVWDTDWTVFDRPKPTVLDFQAVSSRLGELALEERQNAETEEDYCPGEATKAPLRFPSFPDCSWITAFDNEATVESPRDVHSGVPSALDSPQWNAHEFEGARTTAVSLEKLDFAVEEDHLPSAPTLPTPVARALWDSAPEWTEEKGSPESEPGELRFETELETAPKHAKGPSPFKATWARPKRSRAALPRGGEERPHDLETHTESRLQSSGFVSKAPKDSASANFKATFDSRKRPTIAPAVAHALNNESGKRSQTNDSPNAPSKCCKRCSRVFVDNSGVC